jgi:hypothetical protein
MFGFFCSLLMFIIVIIS